MVSPDQEFTCDGEISEWRYWPKTTNPFKAIVWRPTSGNEKGRRERRQVGGPSRELEFDIVGINDIPAPEETDMAVTYTVPEGERIAVQGGDVIGWSFDAASLAFNAGGNETVFWLPDIHEDLAVDQTHEFEISKSDPREYSIQAVVGSSEGMPKHAKSKYLKKTVFFFFVFHRNEDGLYMLHLNKTYKDSAKSPIMCARMRNDTNQ